MTECPSEVNFLQGGNKNSLRILTKGDHIWKSSIFGINGYTQGDLKRCARSAYISHWPEMPSELVHQLNAYLWSVTSAGSLDKLVDGLAASVGKVSLEGSRERALHRHKEPNSNDATGMAADLTSLLKEGVLILATIRNEKQRCIICTIIILH